MVATHGTIMDSIPIVVGDKQRAEVQIKRSKPQSLFRRNLQTHHMQQDTIDHEANVTLIHIIPVAREHSNSV